MDVRREGTLTTFAAIHEPYEDAPRIRQIRRLVESDRIMAIVVAATQFIGYLLLAFDGAESSLKTSGGFVEWGRLSAPTHLFPSWPETSAPENADERTVVVYLQFSPEEVHVSAGRET